MCQTQWRHSSVGLLGLEYSAVIDVIELHHKKRRRRIFKNVQLIEFGALAAFRKLRKGQNG